MATHLGYKYRCLITYGGTRYSDVYTVRFTNTWLGTASNAWEDPANWSCGIVPTTNTNVYVKPGVPYMPVVSSNVVIFGLIVDTGMTVTVNPGYTVTLVQ